MRISERASPIEEARQSPQQHGIVPTPRTLRPPEPERLPVPDKRTSLYPAEPVEPAFRPVGVGKSVCNLNCGDPFWILESKLRGSAQPERKSKRIGDELPGIFG